MEQKKLLVLLDATESSNQTIDYISRVPAFMGMRIVLFHVFTGVPEEFWDLVKPPRANPAFRDLIAWEDMKRSEISDRMEIFRESLVKAGFPRADIDIIIQSRHRGIARDILEEAGRGGYAAVVMRRRGAGALDNVTFGSVSHKLISAIRFLPVMIVGELPPGKKILIGVDGSAHSNRAVDHVCHFFGGQGYVVCLLHVIRGITGFMPDTQDLLDLPEYIDSARKKTGILFEMLRKRLISAGFKPDQILEKITVLFGGITSRRVDVVTDIGGKLLPAGTGVFSRAGAIINEAEEEGYETIVVGRKGLSAVQEFFMGRVSNKVIQDGRKFTIWVI